MAFPLESLRRSRADTPMIADGLSATRTLPTLPFHEEARARTEERSALLGGTRRATN